jgi:hypothetical protein
MDDGVPAAKASFSDRVRVKNRIATKKREDSFIVDLASNGPGDAAIFEILAVERRRDACMPDFPNSTARREDVLDIIRNCLIRDTRALAADPRIQDSSNANE